MRITVLLRSASVAALTFVAASCRTDAVGPVTPEANAAGAAAAKRARMPSGFFVAPNGTSAGDGSAAMPWDLSTALNATGVVQPGDTVWLRGGTYTGIFESWLAGTAAAPVVVREFPGERAIVDGYIDADGAYTTFWGFEITQSDPLATAQRGIDARGPGHRFVNLVIHDVGGSGIGFWMEAVDAEVYGCIVYNNGFEPSMHHGIYVINRDGTKTLEDNVVFDNYAYGIHVYGEAPQALNNVHLIGNTLFDNGSISAEHSRPNLLIGGRGIVAHGMLVQDNTLYYSYDVNDFNMRLGYDATRNGDIVVTNNYMSGGNPVVDARRWNNMTFSGNTIIGTQGVVHLDRKLTTEMSNNTWYRDPATTSWDYAGVPLTLDGWREATGLSATDVALATPPTGVRVVVQPNKYEPGRAFVVVNNWAQQGTVGADLSGVLDRGERYEIRNVQDLFGAPVATGVFHGAPVQIPMQSIAPPATIGRPAPDRTPTGPLFDVYLVQKLPHGKSGHFGKK